MTNNFYLSLASVIVGFGFVIFVHELGHFMVAKWVGIKCTQFAIGFGQALVSWRKGLGMRFGTTEPEYIEKIKSYMNENNIPEDPKLKAKKECELPYHYTELDKAHQALNLGETEYRLNWLPLGGYVKMLGQEDMDPSAQSEDPRSFNRKSIPGRMAVISAGVVMNLIFGMIFFIIAFMFGVNFPPARIGGVMQESPAATTYVSGHENKAEFQGLKRGDVVTHVNDEPIDTFMMLQTKASLSARNEYLTLTVKRGGIDKPIQFKIKAMTDDDVMEGIPTLGVMPARSLIMSVIDPKGKIGEAGVEPGDILTHVDGVPVNYYSEAARIIEAAQGGQVDVQFTRFAKAEEDREPEVIKTINLAMAAAAVLQLEMKENQRPRRHLLGMSPALRVNDVTPGFPAEKAGLKEGDIIAQFGDVSWPNFFSLTDTAEKNAGKKLALEVIRDGEYLRIDSGIIPRKRTKKTPNLGVNIDAVHANYISGFLPGSPLSSLNLPAGSQLVAINGSSVDSFQSAQNLLFQFAKSHLQQQTSEVENEATATMKLVFKTSFKGQETESHSIDLSAAQLNELTELTWNDSNFAPYFGVLENKVQADNILQAAGMGVKHTHQFMLQTYLTLQRVFDGRIGIKHMRGFVGIVDVGAKIANQKGMTYLLFFLGLISVNLVVINFLPIPITDGGHIVLLLIEKIKGSPVSVKAQQAAMFAGLGLIGSVFLITLFYDLSRLFS